MNFLKQLVSKNKTRYQDENFDLDLSYVTDRVIAMAYPSSGIESLYRNHIDDVSNFLQQRHEDKFLIINLSNRKYDYRKFNNQVMDFNWEDHHSPQILILFQICQKIKEFLEKDIDNVVVIHCNAGKGRTGTAVCCFLLYSGRFQEVHHALDYFAKQRFVSQSFGVSQPSQIRYIYYFYKIFKEKQIKLQIKKITSIKFAPVPSFNSQNGCKPIIMIDELINNNQHQIFDNTTSYYDQRSYTPAENSSIQIGFMKELIVGGDVLIRINNNGYFTKTQMFRLAFNPCLIQKNELVLELNDLDPDSVQVDSRFQGEFYFKIQFEDICQCFQSQKSSCEICLNIKKKYSDAYDEINFILDNYKSLNPIEQKWLLFGKSRKDDIDFQMENFYKEEKQLVQKQKQNI